MSKLTKALALIVWNEVGGCRLDVPNLPRAGFDEVFAVDGGSTDGTVEYLEAQGIPVHRQRQPSLNAAYKEAVDRARSDAIVVFFPKGTLEPAVVSEIGRQLDAGFELVIASRNLPGARNEDDDQIIRTRKWGIMILSHVTSLLWRREGPRVRDVLHGVKGFTLDAYRRMHISPVGVSVDLEMVVRSYRCRLRRMEFPVREKRRPHGQTKFPVWSTGKRLARFIWLELFRKT